MIQDTKILDIPIVVSFQSRVLSGSWAMFLCQSRSRIFSKLFVETNVYVCLVLTQIFR